MAVVAPEKLVVAVLKKGVCKERMLWCAGKVSSWQVMVRSALVGQLKRLRVLVSEGGSGQDDGEECRSNLEKNLSLLASEDMMPLRWSVVGG